MYGTISSPLLDNPKRRLDLHLFGNVLGKLGLEVLVQSKWTSHLRVVHLGCNGLLPDSLPCFAKLLSKQNNLQELDLFANVGLFVGEAAVRPFCDSLEQSNLQKLSISMCPIRDSRTAVYLVSHLPSTLEDLLANDCCFSLATYRQLAQSLSRLPRLQKLSVDGWNVKGAQADHLERTWRAALDFHTGLCEIGMNHFAARSSFNLYLWAIGQRNMMLKQCQQVFPGPDISLGCALLSRLVRIDAEIPTEHRPHLSAIYLSLREWIAVAK